VSRSVMRGAISPFPNTPVMTWCSVKTRVQLYILWYPFGVQCSRVHLCFQCHPTAVFLSTFTFNQFYQRVFLSRNKTTTSFSTFEIQIQESR